MTHLKLRNEKEALHMEKRYYNMVYKCYQDIICRIIKLAKMF